MTVPRSVTAMRSSTDVVVLRAGMASSLKEWSLVAAAGEEEGDEAGAGDGGCGVAPPAASRTAAAAADVLLKNSRRAWATHEPRSMCATLIAPARI